MSRYGIHYCHSQTSMCANILGYYWVHSISRVFLSVFFVFFLVYCKKNSVFSKKIVFTVTIADGNCLFAVLIALGFLCDQQDYL